MENAINNLLETLQALKWARVVTERQEPGKGYQIALIPGPFETVRFFGGKKDHQTLSLELSATDGKDISDISARMSLIESAVVEDRRRGGNAQTTIVNEWEIDRQEGREGVTASTQIVVTVLS